MRNSAQQPNSDRFLESMFEWLAASSLSPSILPKYLLRDLDESSQSYAREGYQFRTAGYRVFEAVMLACMLGTSIYSAAQLQAGYQTVSTAQASLNVAACRDQFGQQQSDINLASIVLSMTVGCGLILLEQFRYWAFIRPFHALTVAHKPVPAGYCDRLCNEIYSLREPKNYIHVAIFWAMQISAGNLLNGVIRGFQQHPKNLHNISLFMLIPGLIFYAGGLLMQWNASRYLRLESQRQVRPQNTPPASSHVSYVEAGVTVDAPATPITDDVAIGYPTQTTEQKIDLLLGGYGFTKEALFFKLCNIAGLGMVLSSCFLKNELSHQAFSAYAFMLASNVSSCNSTVLSDFMESMERDMPQSTALATAGVATMGAASLLNTLFCSGNRANRSQTVFADRTSFLGNFGAVVGAGIAVVSAAVQPENAFFGKECGMLGGALLFTVSSWVLNLNSRRCGGQGPENRAAPAGDPAVPNQSRP